ncbi:TonB-dependent receptor, partial [Acinetobacter sp. RF14B]
MSFHKNLITLSIFSVLTPSVWAEQTSSTRMQTLKTIQVIAPALSQTAADFAGVYHIVDQKALSERATSIGDALADELGVYSNQYGSGASRPVIR